jgi:RNA polymerase sigma factor (sigma-70 family)
MTDSQRLLAEYVRNGSDAAFGELVARYVDLVYSTALRLVEGDTHRAEDVAQGVFLDLARKARALPGDVSLGGWLHRDTCLVAGHILRGERRRQSRERQAVEMNVLQNDSEAAFSRIAPVLDEAINELDEADRKAIVLRFFEQHDFRRVGQALGSNEDAARMRVTRALEKLESLLKRRGVTAGSAALGLVLGANAVQAAPAGLAATISTAAALAAGTTLATAATATATATKAIAMTTLQKTLIGATLAAAVGTGIYEVRQAAQLRDANKSLQHQATQLQSEKAALLNRLTATADTKSPPAKSLPDEQFNELLRLRGEVARLRQQAAELGTLRRENEKLRTSLASGQRQQPEGSLASIWLADSNRVAAAQAVVFNAAAGVADKLEALRILRVVNARSDDVVKQMMQAYLSTNDARLRADVFRQLSGVTTAELKPLLVEAVRDTSQASEIRQEAAETLAHYLPDPDAKAWLEHLVANDADAEVREEAARRLQRFQEETARRLERDRRRQGR